MKKVFVISKTHLDLGFTDYAENVYRMYLNTFIPNAIQLAEQVNTPEKKNFIWTTGSWILKEALEHGTPSQQEELWKAIRRGDIVPHALPFTMHTELLDADTLDYGLSIVERLDRIRGHKTVAAKMTDVPGHTRGLVPLLARHGIKLLHIGVNGASPLPKVPPCFLWKSGESEVVVVYSGDYGGAFQSDLADEVLYFDHTHDNSGTPNPGRVLQKLSSIQREFPGYEVSAGTLDDFANVIWEQRGRLPVYEGEIGDTWIHGSASDPYKSAALRELIQLKNKWLAEGSMDRSGEEYRGLADHLLCVAEHTCGMDVKKFFADYEHYLKHDFQRARQADRVRIHHPLRGFPHNVITWGARVSGAYKPGSYRMIEKSWAEQRGYLDGAVQALSGEHAREAERALRALRPDQQEELIGSEDPYALCRCGDWAFRLNQQGGIGLLTYRGDPVIRENNAPVVEYRAYSDEDYDYWLHHYTRNLKGTFSWSVPDFARPLLQYVRGKYRDGRFPYAVQAASCRGRGSDEVRICVNLSCEPGLYEDQGAPREFQILYHLRPQGLQFSVSWYGKDANRLTEALFLRLYPAPGRLRLQKVSEWIDPIQVASMGGRNLHAVWGTQLETAAGRYRLVNRHAPLLSIGRGKILEFDDRLEDPDRDGITYVLYDNVWGTNFPLWYEENAQFQFEITADCPFNQEGEQ